MLRARRGLWVVLVVLSTLLGALPAGAAPRTKPAWAMHIDDIVGDLPFSVSVGDAGEVWYQHRSWVERPPASNEKLLLSMTLLSRFASARTIATEVRANASLAAGVLHGDVWLAGHGDPEVRGKTLAALARQIRDAGVRRIAGAVIGATGPFVRDWWAAGWRDYFPNVYIARPTALTFDRNESATGAFLQDPERRAAQTLTGRLRALGVDVRDPAELGPLPSSSRRLAVIRSDRLLDVMRRMNVKSSNFRAEVLGKWLAFNAGRRPTIAEGAREICSWAAHRGEDFACNDSSGLSYDNRVTTRGVLHLLWIAAARPWWLDLRSTLAKPGSGTLRDRLDGLTLRAKTGTLEDVSALSGWVRSEVDGTWIAFSILSSHFDDDSAKTIEDRIVRVIASSATDPTP